MFLCEPVFYLIVGAGVVAEGVGVGVDVVVGSSTRSESSTSFASTGTGNWDSRERDGPASGTVRRMFFISHGSRTDTVRKV